MNSNVKTGIAVVGLMVAAVFLVGVTPSERTLYQRVGTKTFRMLNPDNLNSGGTGFSVKTPSGATYTVTNAHVCNMTDRPYIVAEQEGSSQRVSILEISQRADLCILSTVSGQTGLSLAASAPQTEHIHIIGHPYLQPLSLRSGYINGKDFLTISYCRMVNANRNLQLASEPVDQNADVYPRPQAPNEENYGQDPSCVKRLYSFFSDAQSAPGNSGSAVINDNGEVVGVLFAGNDRGLSAIVPLEDLKDFIARY